MMIMILLFLTILFFIVCRRVNLGLLSSVVAYEGTSDPLLPLFSPPPLCGHQCEDEGRNESEVAVL